MDEFFIELEDLKMCAALPDAPVIHFPVGIATMTERRRLQTAWIVR